MVTNQQEALELQNMAGGRETGVYILPLFLGRGFDLKFTREAHVFVSDLEGKLVLSTAE